MTEVNNGIQYRLLLFIGKVNVLTSLDTGACMTKR